jgi:dephospho-CoA kinase
MIIGITGTDGAGKGTVVEYLVTKKGFVHHSSRELLQAFVEKAGGVPTRAELRWMGNHLRATEGDDIIVRTALKHIEDNKEQNAIIESIRALKEAETLRAHGGILLLIDADPEIRYARIQDRKLESDRITYEEFLAHEALEANDPDPHGMQKEAVMKSAEYVIYNNESVADLQKQVDIFLERFGG